MSSGSFFTASSAAPTAKSGVTPLPYAAPWRDRPSLSSPHFATAASNRCDVTSCIRGTPSMDSGIEKWVLEAEP